MPTSSEPRQTAPAPTAPTELPAPARENLEVVSSFHDREDASISGIQLAIEWVSRFFGNPWYFTACVVFMLAWVGINAWGTHLHWRLVDAPPFPVLQGLVSSNALLLTIAVLIRQNRMARLAEHRSHLDLQINLLTEQKATKLLQIVHELQLELTALRNRPDSQLEAMKEPADANALLHAIKEKSGNP